MRRVLWLVLLCGLGVAGGFARWESVACSEWDVWAAKPADA
jgi:hypothetical protein